MKLNSLTILLHDMFPLRSSGQISHLLVTQRKRVGRRYIELLVERFHAQWLALSNWSPFLASV